MPPISVARPITPDVPFKADGAMITKELEQLIIRYLSMDEFTLTDTGIITGVNIITIKKIDLERLSKDLYADADDKLKRAYSLCKAILLALMRFKLQ